MDELNYKSGYTYLVANISALLDKASGQQLNKDYILLSLQIVLRDAEEITIAE